MSEPRFVRVQKEGVCLAVKLQPRASKNEIGEALGDELKIKVTAPPVDAAANEALVRLLAETLGCPRGAVQIVRGHTSRHKTVLLQGLAAAEVLKRLTAGR
ncbi:MAG: YggU family protein [Verrucomicrobia bacterium]|nr:YggU family protein [Verrucomicrobiota bacterium]